MQLLCLLLGLVICSYGVKSSEEPDIKVLRRWPSQKGTMVRILKRSTAIPADFDAIDGSDGTLNEDDDPVNQIQNLGIAGLGTENNEAIDEDELLSGLSNPKRSGLFLRASRAAGPIDEDELLSGLSNPKRSGLFLRASRAAGPGLYLRTSRGDPEMIPLSLRNGMLLRSFKRSLNLIHKKSGSGLFLRASKGGSNSKSMVPMGGIFNLLHKKSDPGLFLRTF